MSMTSSPINVNGNAQGPDSRYMGFDLTRNMVLYGILWGLMGSYIIEYAFLVDFLSKMDIFVRNSAFNSAF